MGTCKQCKNTILFGGTKENGVRYCGEACLAEARTQTALPSVPDEVVEREARATREADCPLCHGRGPVEVHMSYRVVSALVITSWRNTPHVLCRGCARKKQVGDLLVSFLFGWWGIPWGLVMTPIQLVRGVIAVASGDVDEDGEPSVMLSEAVRARLAQQVVAESMLAEGTAVARGPADYGDAA